MDGSIVNLSGGKRVDPRSYLTGAWREIGVRSLDPGETQRLVAEDVEYAVYVMSGRGSLAIGGEASDISTGTGITIPRGDEVVIAAGAQSMDLFVVTLDA